MRATLHVQLRFSRNRLRRFWVPLQMLKQLAPREHAGFWILGP